MKNSRARNFWSAVAGTAAIEFAILSVPFAGVTTAAFETARAYWTLEAIQESATQGARCIGIHTNSCYASGTYSASSTVAHVQNVAKSWGIDVPGNAITATQSTSCGNVPGFAEIRISYPFSSVAGKLIPALNNIPLSVSSCFPNNA
ncbi:MAG TPA: TadE family protein [Rhizomicrobium sp.]|jgi:Flp pilus assembly protein TadG